MADRILVVAEHWEGKLNRASFEALAAAQAISRDSAWPVDCVLPGSGLEEPARELAGCAAAHSSERVYRLESPALHHYTSDAYVFALKRFLEEKQPRLVLFPHTYQVRDYAPRLALALGRGLISDAIGYRFEQHRLLFTRQMFQGKFVADVAFVGDSPWLATVQIGSFRGAQPAASPAPIEQVAAAEAETIRVTPHEVFEGGKQAVDLTQAAAIVAVGRGIKEQKNLILAEDLAKVLGGEVAASRPICDNGWLPMQRQVGSSGQTVAPRLYIAIGISGAIQHIVGMKGSGTIVAVNKDPEAPIFEIADYGIVGNLFDIVPLLTEEIRKARA